MMSTCRIRLLAHVSILMMPAARAVAIDIEAPTPCSYADVDVVPAPESCEFRIVNWNASGADENWNLGNDQQVADFVHAHVVALDANVVTLQEASAASIALLEAQLPGWECHYQMFSLDDHLVICVEGSGSNFAWERLRDVGTPSFPPPYWWGYVQLEYQGTLITTVHTRSAWDEEHVTELHENVHTGIVTGDFNYIPAHINPNVSVNPDAVPGPDWHQTDLDLEWTIDDLEREDGVIVEQITSKIDHILTVEPPAVVWGDACLDGRDDVPQPFFSAHRILLGRVAFQDPPAILPLVLDGGQPIAVDDTCSATIPLQITIEDRCCVDAADLAMTVGAIDLEGHAALGPVTVDGVVQDGPRRAVATASVTVTGLQGTATVRVDGQAHDCADQLGDSIDQQTGAVATVVDTIPPNVTAPADVMVQCDHHVPAPDPNSVTASDNCGSVAVVHVGDTDDGMSCPRTISRVYRATDVAGNTAEAVQTIVVDDVTPPQVVMGGSDLFVLWPPNHAYHCFDAAQFTPVIVDNCDVEPTWQFDACVSNQPDNGRGDGNTINDCVLDPDGQGVCARAERAGHDRDGRRYRLDVQAVDACGNASPPGQIGFIHVPHH